MLSQKAPEIKEILLLFIGTHGIVDCTERHLTKVLFTMQIIFSLLIILLIVAAYWALMVFPKQREYKKHIKYLNTIDVGDEVITYGGMIGTVTSIDDEIGVATLQIADGLEVRILTAAINRRFDPDELRQNLRLAQGLPMEMTESGTD